MNATSRPESSRATRPRAPLLPIALFFVSGAAGLVFEVIWTRLLTLVFGASTPAIATVLAVFMGGLALGSWLAGRIADRLEHPLALYALAEGGVGLLALVLPVVIDHAYPPVAGAIGRLAMNQFESATALRFLAVSLVLLPPTTLMGASLPLLARQIARTRRDAPRIVGTLYAVNTFGAVVGTAMAGLVLMPWIHVRATNAVAACANLALAATVYFAHRAMTGTAWPAVPWARGMVASGPQSATATDEDDDDGSLLDGPEPIAEALTAGGRRAVLGAAFGSGFAALAYEVILSRALDMVLGSSVYSFTLILMAFLVGIGGGSGLATWILRARPSPVTVALGGGTAMLATLLAAVGSGQRALVMVFAILAVFEFLALAVTVARGRPLVALGAVQLTIAVGAACTYVFQDRVPRMFVHLAMTFTGQCTAGQSLHFSPHVGAVQAISFLVAALCALPPALGMGATFPLAIRAVARDPATVARDTGAVYSVNTVGSILGSLVTGFALLPHVGMETAFYLAVSVNLALALWLLLVAPSEEPLRYVLVPAAAVLFALTASGTVLGHEGRLARSEGLFALFPKPWDRERMTLGVFRLSLADGMIVRRNGRCVEGEESERERGLTGDNPIFYRDGITTTVTVERWSLGARDHYALKNNGKVDASNGDDMPTQLLVSALPLLLHPKGPDGLRVAMVGWGSGISVGTALRFPVAHVDAIELERATIDASRFFSGLNGFTYSLPAFPYVEHPRLRVVNDDARNFVAAVDRPYDVVVSEPSNPWITGVSNLFTVESFRRSARAIAPDGIFVQWVQLYEMSPENIKTVYRTVAEAFPYLCVFAADADSSDTIVVASHQPVPLDPGVVQARLDALDPHLREALRPAHIERATDLFARVLLGSRDEVLRFAHLDDRRESGVWKPFLRATGDEPCVPGVCRRREAPINTDDNARIEFSAPRDLIGFDAFGGYTELFYDEIWPYGRVETGLRTWADDRQRASLFASLAASHLAMGRPHRAGEALEEAVRLLGGRTPDAGFTEVVDVFAAVTTLQEPTLRMTALSVPREMSESLTRQVQFAYRSAIERYREQKWSEALASLEAVPASAREACGPSLRLLHGVLLYRASADGSGTPRFSDAAEALDTLARDEPAFTDQHPELHFYLGRARFRMGSYPAALGSFQTFAARLRAATTRDHERPDVDAGLPEPDPSNAPVTDAPGESDKDRRAAAR